MPDSEKRFEPNALDARCMETLISSIEQISKLEPSSQHDRYYQLAKGAASKAAANDAANGELKPSVCFALLGDLSDQGWIIGERNGSISVKQVSHRIERGEDAAKAKSVVR